MMENQAARGKVAYVSEFLLAWSDTRPFLGHEHQTFGKLWCVDFSVFLTLVCSVRNSANSNGVIAK